MATQDTTGNTPVEAAALPPLDLANALSYLCGAAQANVCEARAEWLTGLPTLADGIGSQAARLCTLLAEQSDNKETAEQGFHLMGNLLSLLAGLANVSEQMAFTHQRLVTERLAQVDAS